MKMNLYMRTAGKPGSGFSLVELMIVVSVLGLLAAIAIPNFVKSRDTSQLRSIYNNLRIIDAAKDQWALENKKGTGDTTSMLLLSEYIKGGEIRTVVNETYTTSDMGTLPFAVCPTRLGTYRSEEHTSE